MIHAHLVNLFLKTAAGLDSPAAPASTPTPASTPSPTTAPLSSPGKGSFAGSFNLSIPKLPFNVNPTTVLHHGLPDNMSQLGNSYKQYSDPKYTPFSKEKWEGAKGVNDWVEQNKAHPVTQEAIADPSTNQALSLYNSPVGQLGSKILPTIGQRVSDPTEFANLARIPGLQNLFQGVMGTAGLPGLAFAHSYLSGNMQNWNTLTEGLTNPDQRYPGRNFSAETNTLFNKPGFAKQSKINIMDRYLTSIGAYLSRKKI